MPLSEQQLERIALLSRLRLTPAEIDEFTSELEAILAYFSQVQSLDTEGVEPQTRRFATAENVFREDQVTASLPVREALRNAPGHDGEFFVIPRVIDL